jgi:hypothetical protein
MTVRRFAEDVVARLSSTSRLVSVPTPAVAIASRVARFVPLPLYPDQLARLQAPKPHASHEAAADLAFRPRPIADLIFAG